MRDLYINPQSHRDLHSRMGVNYDVQNLHEISTSLRNYEEHHVNVIFSDGMQVNQLKDDWLGRLFTLGEAPNISTITTTKP